MALDLWPNFNIFSEISVFFKIKETFFGLQQWLKTGKNRKSVLNLSIFARWHPNTKWNSQYPLKRNDWDYFCQQIQSKSFNTRPILSLSHLTALFSLIFNYFNLGKFKSKNQTGSRGMQVGLLYWFWWFEFQILKSWKVTKLKNICPHPITILIIVGAFSALGFNIYNREEEVLLIRDKCDYGHE